MLKLVNGDDPGLPLKGLVRPRAWIIPLASIHALEFSRPDAIDVDVIYSQGSTKTSSVLTFPTAAERDVFFAEAGQLLGCSFAQSQRRRTFIGATSAPLTVLVIVTLLTVGAVFLSRYWIANPPPPIQRTGKQDEIVRYFDLGGAGRCSCGGSRSSCRCLRMVFFSNRLAPANHGFVADKGSTRGVTRARMTMARRFESSILSLLINKAIRRF